MFVLVADELDRLTLRRVRTWHRLVARCRTASLDEALAGGAVPELSVYLAVRASQLTSARSRRNLAAGLRRVLAGGPAQPAGVPIRRAQVARAATELDAVADRLLAPGPVPADGVAMVHRLLSDGSGPLYRETPHSELRHVATCAAKALASAPATAH